MSLRLLCALAVTAALAAQSPSIRDDAWKGGAPVPPGAVAVIDGLPVPVELFVDEMAARHVRADSSVGRETLSNLIDEVLVANEAARRNVAVPEADVECRIKQLDCQLRQARTSLDAEMQAKGITMALFRSKIRKLLLLEALTREDQRIPKGVEVSNEQQKVWLKNRRDTAKIELDRSRLKRGEVALIDGTPLEDAVFVKALLSAVERREVRRVADMLLQYVFGMRLTEQAGAPLTDADVDLEFIERKRTFESNPEYRGIEYETIVKERTGYDPAALKQSRGFRLNAAISCLGRKLFSPVDVKGYYETNLAYFGPRYTVRHLLIRGSDRPLRDQAGKPLTQPLAQARQQIDGIRGELGKGKPFEDLVRMYSEHLPTKIRGGLLDPFTPKEAPQGFPEIGEAVTRMEIGRVSDPVLTSAGYHLVRVERMDPAPPVEEVEARIRIQMATRYFNDAYEKAVKGYDIRVE